MADQGFIACLPSSEMLCDKLGAGVISVMKCLLFYCSSDYGKNICIVLRVSSGLSKDVCSGILCVAVFYLTWPCCPFANVQYSSGRF